MQHSLTILSVECEDDQVVIVTSVFDVAGYNGLKFAQLKYCDFCGMRWRSWLSGYNEALI
jgi:hypothetical protein